MTSSNISRNTPTHTRSSPATITTYNISRAHTRTHTHTHIHTRTCAHTHTHAIPTQQLAQAIQFFSYFHNFGTHLLQSEVDAALWEKLWRKYLHFLGQQHRCRSNSRAGCLESRLTRMTSCCSLPLKLLLLLLLYSPLLTSPRVEGQGMCRNPVLRWWQSVQCHRKEEPVRSLKVKDQFIGWEPFGKAGRRGEFSHNTSYQWVIQTSYGKENQNWLFRKVMSESKQMGTLEGRGESWCWKKNFQWALLWSNSSSAEGGDCSSAEGSGKIKSVGGRYFTAHN